MSENGENVRLSRKAALRDRVFGYLGRSRENRRKFLCIAVGVVWVCGLITAVALAFFARKSFQEEVHISPGDFAEIHGYTVDNTVFTRTADAQSGEKAGVIYDNIGVSAGAVTVYFSEPLERDLTVRLYSRTEIYDKFSDEQALIKTAGADSGAVSFALKSDAVTKSLMLEVTNIGEGEIFGLSDIYVNEPDLVSKIVELNIFRIFIHFILFTVCCLFVLLFGTSARLENKYLIIAGTLGVCFVLVNNPLWHSDEGRYYTNAYQLSSALMFRPADSQIAEQSFELWRGKNSAETYSFLMNGIQDFRQFALTGNDEVEAGEDIRTFRLYFAQNLPAAIGVTLGRLFGGNYMCLLYLARLCNLFFYLTCGYWAIKMLAKIKTDFANTMFILGISSTALSMAATVVADYFGNALGFLLTSAVVCAVYSEERLTAPRYAMIFLCSVLLAPFKIVFFPLCFLCLVIPAKRFTSDRDALIKKSVIIACSAVFFIVFQLGTVLHIPEVSRSDVDIYDLSFIFQHPLETLRINIKTFFEALATNIHGAIQFRGAWTIQFLMVAVSFLSVSCREGEIVVCTRKQRIFSFSVVLLVTALTYVGDMLHWTPYGMNAVFGVQTRYFMPILPLLFLSLKSRIFVCKKNIGAALIGAAVFLQCWTVFDIVNAAIDSM